MSKVLVLIAFSGVAAFAYFGLRGTAPIPDVPQQSMAPATPEKSTSKPLYADRQPFSSDSGKLDSIQEAKRLAEIASAGTVDEIAAQLKERDADVQIAAVKKLLAIPNTDSVIASHYLRLSDPAKALVNSVALKPERTHLRQELQSCAISALQSAGVESRLNAVKLFRSLSCMPPAKEFSAFLLTESDPQVLSESIDLAGASRNAELHSTLLKLAEAGTTGIVRRRALENLVSTGARDDDATLRVACKCLDDADGAVRLGAVIALGYQGWGRVPADARERIKTLATSDTYRPQNASTFPVQDAARVLVMSGNEKLTSASTSEQSTITK